MNKKVAVCVIIAAIAVIYAKTCKAETICIELTPQNVIDIRLSIEEIESIDQEAGDIKHHDLVSRADTMLAKIEARIERINKFQKEHGHK